MQLLTCLSGDAAAACSMHTVVDMAGVQQYCIQHVSAGWHMQTSTFMLYNNAL